MNGKNQNQRTKDAVKTFVCPNCGGQVQTSGKPLLYCACCHSVLRVQKRRKFVPNGEPFLTAAEEKSRFFVGYGKAFLILTAFLGLLFIGQLWGIYRSAPRKAFSRASVAAAFYEIAPIVWLWVLALGVNILFSLSMPKRVEKIKGGMDNGVALRTWRKKFVDGGSEVAGVTRVRVLRYVAAAVGFAFIAFACVWSALYLLDDGYVVRRSGKFFATHNGLVDRLLTMLPWIGGAIAVGIALSYVWSFCCKREIALLKAEFTAAVLRKKKGETVAILQEKGAVDGSLSTKWLAFKRTHQKAFAYGLAGIRIGLCVAGVVLIVLGVQWGGMDLVFEKARSICQQCIGLG